jgi:hypothetical protein
MESWDLFFVHGDPRCMVPPALLMRSSIRLVDVEMIFRATYPSIPWVHNPPNDISSTL